MKRLVTSYFLIFFLFKTEAQPLQLAPPQTPATRLFFSEKTAIPFDFRMEGATIRYTTDGSQPDEKSSIYSTPVPIYSPAVIQAKVFAEGFLPSEAAVVKVLPANHTDIDSIAISPKANKYTANGWTTLCDEQLGDENFQKNWLGFDKKKISLTCFFSKKQRIQEVSLSLMQQQGAWIFLPQHIEIQDDKGKILTQKEILDAAQQLPDSLEILTLQLPKKRRLRKMAIVLTALPALPAWHDGAGNAGWIFLDEVMVR